MSYYEDLSFYNYRYYSEKELNIGWLQHGQPISVGKVPIGFIKKLKNYYKKEYAIMQTAGSHKCEFCGDIDDGYSNEIRVLGLNGIIYAAPSMLKHYINKHKYLPPQEFIDAVMNGPVPGSDEYKLAIAKMPEFWERRKPDSNDEDYEKKIRDMMIKNMSESIDKKILDEILSKSDDFKNFIDSYNNVMPAVYKVNLKKEKS